MELEWLQLLNTFGLPLLWLWAGYQGHWVWRRHHDDMGGAHRTLVEAMQRQIDDAKELAALSRQELRQWRTLALEFSGTAAKAITVAKGVQDETGGEGGPVVSPKSSGSDTT